MWCNVVQSIVQSVGEQLLASSACAHCDASTLHKQHSQSLAFWTWSNHRTPFEITTQIYAHHWQYLGQQAFGELGQQSDHILAFFVRSRRLTGRDRAEFSGAILWPELHLWIVLLLPIIHNLTNPHSFNYDGYEALNSCQSRVLGDLGKTWEQGKLQ